jgi:hypothetical protein
VVIIGLLEDPGQKTRDQPVEETGFGQSETQPLNAGDLIAHLGLARDGLDHLSEDDPDADAGADGAKATADPDTKTGADTGRDVEEGD